MKQILKLGTLLACTTLISCSSLSNQDIGVVTGGIAGGVLGSTLGGGTGKLVMVGVGTIAGSLIGGAIGKNMDKVDHIKVQRSLEQTPTGKTKTWHNPDTGNTYRVRPVKTYNSNTGSPCREYKMTAIIGGKNQEMYGTACRQADGSWKTKN